MGGNPWRVFKVLEVLWAGDWISFQGWSPRHDSCQALESEDLRPISHLRLTGHMSLGGSFHVPCMSFLFFNHKMRTLASEWS